MPKFRCIVATPTREMFLGEVESAKIPGSEGYFGVLANHENFVGILGEGLVTLNLDAEGREKKQFVVSKGFAQMMNNHLAILPRFGCAEENLSLEHAQERIAEITAELEELKQAEADSDDIGLETLNARLTYYNAQVEYLNGNHA